MQHQLLLAIISFTTLTTAFAAEDNPPDSKADASQVAAHQKQLHYVLGVGLTSGGDKLATAFYTDGSSDSISAGSGLMFYAGLDYRMNDAASIQGTLGYHFDSTKAAKNGEITFSRIPLEFLAYYHVRDTIRLGGGTRMVFSPRVKGSGLANNINDSFPNTVGLVIEGEYLVTPTLGIKVRHVSEKYKPRNSPTSVDGSHFGVFANVYF